MKKIICYLCLLLLFNANAEELNLIEPEIMIESQLMEDSIEEIEETELEESSETATPLLEAAIEERYNYTPTLDDLNKYSLIALQNAFIGSHIRGSIWIGGILTAHDWCGVDDGAFNHKPSGTTSYVYINDSNIYFQGRTNNQSATSYKLLQEGSVIDTQNYWGNLINKLPNNDIWVYMPPDENGYVNLIKRDYQNEGDDETIQEIKKIYWTNATKVDVEGLAGHLIAPFADVNIIRSNHRGCIVGKNIHTDAEAHINYWKPNLLEPTSTPSPGKIILQKTLINDVWHIRCDVMDGTTFESGGGFWKADVIMNTENVTSKEGHRSNKCGNADHWIIWLNNEGIPFRMDEIKSGATDGTLPTMIFEEVYSPEDLGLVNWNQLEPTDFELIEKYKENFKKEKDITTIVPGERIYWITWNGNQKWYHTGVPYVAPPTFTFYIDGEPYPIVAGHSLELDDVLPGAHEIKEEVDLNDYIITVYGANTVENTTSTVNIVNGETIEVEYVNERITPPTAVPSTPPTFTPTPTSTPTPTPTPELTLTPTPTAQPTASPTATPIVTLTPSPTPKLTQSPSPIPTLTLKPTSTPTVSPSPTLTPTPTPTCTPSPKPITPSPSPSSTPVITLEPTTASPNLALTATKQVKPSKKPKSIPETEINLDEKPTPTVVPTYTPTPGPTITPERRKLIIEYIKANPPTPDFSIEELTEQELEDLIEIFDYQVPIYGRPLKTDDNIPISLIIIGIIGILLLFLSLHIKGGKENDFKERK